MDVVVGVLEYGVLNLYEFIFCEEIVQIIFFVYYFLYTGWYFIYIYIEVI